MTGGYVIREFDPSNGAIAAPSRHHRVRAGGCLAGGSRQRKAYATGWRGLPPNSMRPWGAARIGEIIRVGDDAPRRWFRIEYAISDPIVLAIGDRLFLGGKTQPHLLPRIGGTGPPHERLDLLGGGLVEVEHP